MNLIRQQARFHGIRLQQVHPNNTSRTCSRCGYCHSDNRVSQDECQCQSCKHQAHADVNAAANIADKAASQAVKDSDLETVRRERLRRNATANGSDEFAPPSKPVLRIPYHALQSERNPGPRTRFTIV